MAKKKSQEDTVDGGVSLKEINDSIIKKYGSVIKTGTEVLKSVKNLKVLSVSPALDIALGGGLREGSVVILTSDPKCGKTVSSLHFAAKHQKEKNIIYVNTENRLSEQNFSGIQGLDPSKIHVVESDETKILSAEEYLTIIEKYVKLLPDSIIIVDSTSNMIPQEELDGEIKAGIRNSLPRLLSLFCKKIAPYLVKNRVIMIMITHNIANTSGKGKTKMSDCGNMIKFQASTNITINYTQKWTDKDENQIGQQLFWEVITSNAGGTPGSKAEGWLRYGTGIDEVQEIYHIGLELGFIRQGGAWFYIGDEKFQGAEKMVEYFKNNKEAFNKLITEINSVV